MKSLKVVAWIDENRAFLEEAVDVLAPFISVPSAVNLLYRYREQPPPTVLPRPLDDDEDDGTERWERSEERHGWVYLQKPERATTPLSVAPVRPNATAGMAWNRVVALGEVPEEEVEAVVPEEETDFPDDMDDEALKAILIKDMLEQERAFECETRTNELLLDVLADLKEIAERHNCCYGVHSSSFVYTLEELLAK